MASGANYPRTAGSVERDFLRTGGLRQHPAFTVIRTEGG
jgi:hypothetical protein